MSQFLLRPTPDRDYHMLRAALFDNRKKRPILDYHPVLWRDITVIDFNSKRFLPRPIEQFLPRAITRQYPENVRGPLAFERGEQSLQIFKARNARDFSAA